jgi:hypothetical protein
MTQIDRDFLQRLARVRTPGCPSTADLGAYLDRTRTAEFNATLEQHLRACPACTNELIDLRELQTMQREGESAPAALVDKLDALRRSRRPARARAQVKPLGVPWWESLLAWLPQPRYAGAAAAAALVAVVAVSLLQQPMPDGLIPRGALDPARLEAASAALVEVRAGGRATTGIAVDVGRVLVLDSALGGAVELEVAGTAAVVAYRDALADLALLRAAVAATPVRVAVAADVVAGVEVLAIAPGEDPVRGSIVSVGAARWQGDDGVAHEATLVETRLDAQPEVLGVPVLTAQFELAGIHAFSNDDASYAIGADTIRAFLAAAPPN